MKIYNFILEHTWAIITLVSAVFIAIGAFNSSIGQQKAERKNEEMKIELKNKTDEISQLQKLTIQLQAENKQKLQEQYDFITGGNSYPTLTFSSVPDKPHIFVPTLWVDGVNPLYKFSMRISYTNSDMKNIEYACDEIRQITPQNFTDLFFDLSKNPTLELNVRFMARNGSWNQSIEFRKNDKGEFQYKTQVIAHHGDKTPLVNKEFDDTGIKVGSFRGLDSLTYKRRN